MAEIGEADDGVGADAQHLGQHLARFFHRLERARENHVVERVVRIIDQLGIGVALHNGHSVRHGALHFPHVNLDAARVAFFLAVEMVDQRAVGAADVEHARAGFHQLGDQRQVDADFARGRGHCNPACSAQPARNPRNVL